MDVLHNAEPTKLVCFQIQNQEYSADIEHIKESLTLRPITKVALTPPWLSGIMNLRGDVVAVIDLSLMLGMAATALRPESRIVVARFAGRTLGFLCDRLNEVRTVDLESLQPPPHTLPDACAALLLGISTLDDGAALRVLDLPALFESKQLAAFRRGGHS